MGEIDMTLAELQQGATRGGWKAADFFPVGL
jgi:hypothetical protein